MAAITANAQPFVMEEWMMPRASICSLHAGSKASYWAGLLNKGERAFMPCNADSCMECKAAESIFLGASFSGATIVFRSYSEDGQLKKYGEYIMYAINPKPG